MISQSTNEKKCAAQANPESWSIERQVRIAAGILILLGIVLAFTVYPTLIWLSVVVALGMVLSGITDSCALGCLIQQLPWNRCHRG